MIPCLHIPTDDERPDMPTPRHRRLLPAFAVASLPGLVPAQLPTDAAVVLEATTVTVDPNYRIVDLFGRGHSTMRGQNVFLQPPPVSVATDPGTAGAFWFQANPASFAGTWRYDVGSLASITRSTWGAWLRTAGERVECGASMVFTLRAGSVESCRKAAGAPQTPTLLFVQPNAIDLAVREPLLYVASFDPGLPAALVEYDISTRTSRTVGSYADVRAIAIAPTGTELLLGTGSGDLITVDVATGATTGTTPTNLGAIVAVGYSRVASKVYASSTELWSELVPTQPIYRSSLPIVDFGVTTVPTASVVLFGTGCGAGQNAGWAANGLPLLGTTGFQLQLRAGVASSFALFALGSSRTFAGQLAVQLPYDLQPFGAPGCPLLVDPQTTLLRPTNATGEAAVTIPIPNVPNLVGSEFAAQWFVPDAGTGTLGVASTEGAAFVLR